MAFPPKMMKNHGESKAAEAKEHKGKPMPFAKKPGKGAKPPMKAGKGRC